MNNKTHIDHLGENIPELLASDILDVGSGRGDFVISIAMRGGRAIGLEKSPTYRALTKEKAAAERLYVTVVDGVGENMPFPDESFDFVNMSEVIEHVDDPGRVLKEVYRVLRARGKAYISIPNRFGMKDPHFHLYGINWLPRFLADPFIGFLAGTKITRTQKLVFKILRRCATRRFAARSVFLKSMVSAQRMIACSNSRNGLRTGDGSCLVPV